MPDKLLNEANKRRRALLATAASTLFNASDFPRMNDFTVQSAAIETLADLVFGPLVFGSMSGWSSFVVFSSARLRILLSIMDFWQSGRLCTISGVLRLAGGRADDRKTALKYTCFPLAVSRIACEQAIPIDPTIPI